MQTKIILQNAEVVGGNSPSAQQGSERAQRGWADFHERPPGARRLGQRPFRTGAEGKETTSCYILMF